jgi:hypothetical protein
MPQHGKVGGVSEHDALDALAEADYQQVFERAMREGIHSSSPKAAHMLAYRHGYRDAIRHGTVVGETLGALHRAIPVLNRFTEALEHEG